MEAGRVHLCKGHDDQEDKPRSKRAAHHMGARGQLVRRPPPESQENGQVWEGRYEIGP